MVTPMKLEIVLESRKRNIATIKLIQKESINWGETAIRNWNYYIQGASKKPQASTNAPTNNRKLRNSI